jgi:hypothetical protein
MQTPTMPAPAPVAYPDWKAPKTDGDLLIWPEPDDVLAQTRENHRRLSTASDVLVQGVPLPELRRRMRAWIGHADDAQPLIATGHQTELYHAGVWAKDALTHAAARRLDAQAYHFAVDTDSPKHLHLRWPGRSEPITDDPNLASAEWAGLVDAPTPRHVQGLESTFAEAAHAWDFTPAAHSFLESLRRLAIEPSPLPVALTNATHELDWSLGLRHHALVMSPVWTSEPYLVFLHHLLGRARQFARDYNASLAEYRAAHDVRTPTRPMPDVAVFDEAVEAPFWLDHLGSGHRARPSVFDQDGSFVLKLNDGDEFAFDPAADAWEAAGRLAVWMRTHDVRLAPRALTLTTFFRLLLADNFVHGIGGGRYDQVTDRLIARHFHLPPPAFAVTTATLYLPQAVGRTRACLSCIEQEGHRLRHALIGAERKRELVAAINAAPRNSQERRHAFYAMHRQLKAAEAAGHPSLKKWEQRLRDAERRDAEDAQLFDRELFYAIQPRERLSASIDRYAAAFG